MSVRTSLGLAGSQAARAHFLGSTRHWFRKGLWLRTTPGSMPESQTGISLYLFLIDGVVLSSRGAGDYEHDQMSSASEL